MTGPLAATGPTGVAATGPTGLTVAAVVVIIAAAAVALAVPVTLLARRRSSRGSGRGRLEADLLARLTEEVRGWRAEAEHWRGTALRLQAELDRERGGGRVAGGTGGDGGQRLEGGGGPG